MPPEDDGLGLGSEAEERETLSLGDGENENLDKENLDDDDDNIDDGANSHGIPSEIYAKLNDLEKNEIPNGWRPKAMYEGEDDDFVSAKKFKQTGELFSEIGKLKNQAKESNASMDERLKNATMFINVQNNQLRQQLVDAKKEAIKQGNVEEVEKIDDKLKEIPEEEKEDKEKKQSDDQSLLLDWKSENSWVFDESSEKFKFADNHFKIALNKKMSMSESLEYVNEKVSKKYPAKSADVNERRNEAGLGEGGSKGGGGKKGANVIPQSQWSDEEKSVAASLDGDFTKKEIAQMVTDSRRAS